MEPIRVLIADDDAMVRRAMLYFLTDVPGIVVVGAAADGEEAISMAAAREPDVVIMDVNMPGVDGVEATRRILVGHPTMHVLAVTALGAYEAVIPMLRAGASGYLLKDSEPEDIIAGIRQVHVGNGTLSPAVTKRLIADVIAPNEPQILLPPGAELSERQLAVVQQLALGRSNTEIAVALHLSEGTVKGCLGKITTKWKVRDRMQILIHAVRAGLVSL